MLDTLTYMRMYETKFNNGLIGRIPQPKPPERRLGWEVYEDCQERLCYLSISAKIDQKVLKKSIETAKERFKQPEKPRRIAAPKPKKTRRILPPVVRKDFICLRCGSTDPPGEKGSGWYCAKCRQEKLDKEYHRTSLFQEAQKKELSRRHVPGIRGHGRPSAG